MTYDEGAGPSIEKYFTLNGSNLDGSDVIITAPTNYEISLSSGSGFQSTPLHLLLLQEQIPKFTRDLLLVCRSGITTLSIYDFGWWRE
jgi:hypothetical protein